MICDQCETVAHCMKNGCVPKTTVQQDIPDLIAGALGVSRGTAYDMMREALAAQPAQQEPVAYIRKDQLQKAAQSPMLCEVTLEPRQDRIGIYTSPPQRKPLTYAELMALAKNSGFGPENVSGLLRARLEIYGRAIEAAHGIKENT